MTALRAISLLGATVTMGLIAGVFALYAHTIMPGLSNTDDRTFVTAAGLSRGSDRRRQGSRWCGLRRLPTSVAPT